MMKIGILTFHRAYNYGAVLQAYALQTYLKDRGCDVYIIDYYNKNVYSNYKLINWKLIFRKNIIKSVFAIIEQANHFTIKRKKKKVYTNFFNHYYRLISWHEITNLDLIIIGSDQVWNPNIVGGFKNAYFGFGIPKNINLISYAASTEGITLNENNTIWYKKMLEQFKVISVRERAFKNYLEKIIDMPVYLSLDPTLLMPFSFWKKFGKISLYKNYILVYQARRSLHILTFAEKIAKQINAQIVILTSNVSTVDHKYVVVDNASPEEFVGLFENARCVIALSFHAVVFSVVSQVPFYAIKNKDGWDNRIESLLDELDLMDRFIDVNEDINYTSIDYSKTMSQIERLKAMSVSYLDRVLGL